MEVTPEIFAWLTSLNIINPFVYYPEELVDNFQIPEKTISLLFGGKYLDIMIQPLQDAYNKFYNIKEDYISGLMKLKHINEGQEYISNSLKYANWKIIFEVLSHFGLIFSEDELSLLVNNNMDQLKKVISKIYDAYTKYLNGANNTDIKNKLYKKVNLNNYNNNKAIDEKINKQNTLMNINEINPLKNYDECDTLLEFIIISLCKNMNMKPRQAITLLSKNRKYLKKICISGYNYNFDAIRNWLGDLHSNKDLLIKLINNTEDGLNICFSTIGAALYCKELDISLQAGQLLYIIKYKIGMNLDWFYNEGIDIFIFILNKEESKLKKDFFDLLYDFIKDNITLFFDEIKKKFNSNNNINKKSIYDFFSNIMTLSNHMDKNFAYYFQNCIYDLCLKNNNDISYNLSLLSDTFFNFTPIEENNAAKIIAYFKDSIKCNVQNIYSTGIFQSFILMERFGKIKNKYAPHFYKNITFIFIEEYDNEIKREMFLENFEKFFNENPDIPIDILIEPYLNKICGCQNYGLSDFLFLLKIVEHPRIEAKDLSDIIQFLLNVCLNNIIYTRCANLILSLIFEKKLIEKFSNIENDKIININNDLSYFEEIENKFIDFIHTALDLYISNISKKEDKFILETPYDIMTQNYENVNMQVKDMIINCVKKYRKIKRRHSSGLLSLMWYYDDNDDIMMQIEELNRPIYEPMAVYLERKRLEQEERDKHDYTKKLMISLQKLKEKRMNIILNREALKEQKKFKEDKIRRKMMERRRIVRLMSGIEARIRPQILDPEHKLTKNNSDFNEIYNKYNMLNRPNNLETGLLKSNMKYAVNIAAKNYANKGVIDENSKFFQKLNSETNYQNNINNNNNIILKKSKSELDIFNYNNQEAMLRQYGMLATPIKNKKYYQNETELKSLKKIELSKLLVQKEGTLISHDFYYKNKKYLLPRNIFTVQYVGVPFDLAEEEPRELKAIKGYNQEYRKNLKYYFKVYSNESKQKISKSKLVKLLRDIGIDKEKIQYHEISTLIRLMFRDNFSEFDFNQFINLLIQLSYIIYIKRRPCLTIGETYSNLLKRFTFKNINHERISFLRQKYQKVIDYLLQLKEDNEHFNIPDGFKFVKNTYVKYNCRLAPHMQEYLGENKWICYQILEEIIYDACKSSIIEPYVEITNEEEIVIEPEKIHNWSPGLTMAYIDLDKSLKFHGIFAADALEDIIKKILRKNYDENIDGKMIKYAKGLFNIKWVKQDLEKKREYYNNQKIEKERKKMKYESEKNRYKPTITKEEYELVEEKFKKIKDNRKKKEKEKKDKETQRAKKEKEIKEKKKYEMIPFFKTTKKKLKEQFKSINFQQKKLKKEREEEEKKESEKYKRKEYIVSEREKNYNEFEKNINNSMKQLSEKEEIKQCFDKYNNHLKIIYDIYSKIGYNKIAFSSKEVIHIDEFKQFLINFAILGVYISSEQMSWIFKNIAKVSQNKRSNEMFFDFDDFKLSICYLSIFSKYENKSWKIMPKDIQETNEKNLEIFFNKLGFKLPFNKVELEKFINERRSMTMKNLLSLQHTKRLEEAINHKNNINHIKNTEENNNNESNMNNMDKNENKNNKEDKKETITSDKKENKNEKNDNISNNKSNISNNKNTNDNKSIVNSDNKKQNNNNKQKEEEENEEEEEEKENE